MPVDRYNVSINVHRVTAVVVCTVVTVVTAVTGVVTSVVYIDADVVSSVLSSGRVYHFF